MKQSQIGWLILVAGGAALAYWYWTSRQGATFGPGALTAPGGSVPLTGTSVQAVGSGQGLTIDGYAGARGAYGAQAQCNATGGRFIKTITKPAFGICVSNATFAAWMASGLGSDYLTDQQVQAWLGAYQSAQSGAGGQVQG